MKCSIETIKNLLPQGSIFHNVLVFVNIDQGIHNRKSKVARNEKNLSRFSSIHKIKQIFKRFKETFIQCQALISEEYT